MCLCSKKAVDDVVNTGKICILDLEEQGVRNVKRTALDARYIFIKPPSMAALVSVVCSLHGRAGECRLLSAWPFMAVQKWLESLQERT